MTLATAPRLAMCPLARALAESFRADLAERLYAVQWLSEASLEHR